MGMASQSTGLAPFVGSHSFRPLSDSLHFPGILKCTRRSKSQSSTSTRSIFCLLNVSPAAAHGVYQITNAVSSFHSHSHLFETLPVSATNDTMQKLSTSLGQLDTILVADIDPATAKMAIGVLGPFLSAYGFLFILRIIMSWYPKLPVGKFPYVVAYAPTEPLLRQTRKVIPPLGGVDVTPVVWFGLVSFLNEILVGPQGLLVLLSQKV